ncbi:MAG: ParB/RepB/Spo0J family partition protein [Candidatus Bathyarchaeia archaeon]|jgi:ParB family chromosome partitioning protein
MNNTENENADSTYQQKPQEQFSLNAVNLPLELIDPDPDQPRKYFDDQSLKRLAESIKQDGLLQPILVRPNANRYLIVHGERRFRAHKVIGLKTICCFVKDLTDSQARDLQLVENLDRRNLLPIELARDFARRIEAGQTQEQIARVIGRSRGFVEQRLNLLRLPLYVQEQLTEGKLSFTRARELLTSQEEDKQICASNTPEQENGPAASLSNTSFAGHPQETEDKKNASEVFNVNDLALGRLLTTRKTVTRGELWQAIDQDMSLLRGD